MSLEMVSCQSLLRDVKVLIGMPNNFGYVPVPFMMSVVEMDAPENTRIQPVSHPVLSEMRNYMAEIAIQDGFTHLLMLDTDMTYPENTLLMLLKDDVDIVTGLSAKRTPPHIPFFFKRSEKPSRWNHDIAEIPEEPGVYEVSAVGGGGTLIRTEVFKNLERPWFSFAEKNEDQQMVGEDIYFSVKASEAGYQLYCDTRLTYGHLVPMCLRMQQKDDHEWGLAFGSFV